MSSTAATSFEHGFRDLVPWADPYIVEIVRKLQHSTGGFVDGVPSKVRAEAPPPLLEPDVDTWLPPRMRGDRLGRYLSGE